MTLTPEQIQKLKAPLNPAHVVVAKAGGFGPKGDYLEGWHVINELNRVFGFDGWSYTILGLALYDKSRANVQAPPPPPSPKITEDQRIELMGLLDATNVPVAEMLKAAKITDLRDVLASEFENGKKWINKRARELQAAQAKVDA
jgi:hypothetical protein